MNIIKKKDIASEQFFFLTASVVDHSGKNEMTYFSAPDQTKRWFQDDSSTLHLLCTLFLLLATIANNISYTSDREC